MQDISGPLYIAVVYLPLYISNVHLSRTSIAYIFHVHISDKTLTVKTEPIQQNVYVGLISQFHNQSFLGMSKERGGYSF